jgi:hypothetical protein
MTPGDLRRAFQVLGGEIAVGSQHRLGGRVADEKREMQHMAEGADRASETDALGDPLGSEGWVPNQSWRPSKTGSAAA